MDYKKLLLQLIENVGKGDGAIDFVLKSTSLDNAIERAFYSENEERILNTHQQRIGREKLKNAKEFFFKNNFNKQLTNCKDFEDVLNLIKRVEITQFGGLAVYDISLRIALYLNKEKQTEKFSPQYVYLYGSGPRGAYKEIFKKRIYKNKVSPNCLENKEIGNVIIKSNLTTWQKEILLCNFSKQKIKN